MHAPDTADVENAWNEPMSTDLAANEVRFPKREADIIRELIEKNIASFESGHHWSLK